MIANAILAVLSFAVAAARFSGATSQAFQAVAHMLTAGLLASAVAWPSGVRLGLFLGLCGTETICAANQHLADGPLQSALIVIGSALLLAGGIAAACDLLLTAIERSL